MTLPQIYKELNLHVFEDEALLTIENSAELPEVSFWIFKKVHLVIYLFSTDNPFSSKNTHKQKGQKSGRRASAVLDGSDIAVFECNHVKARMRVVYVLESALFFFSKNPP